MFVLLHPGNFQSTHNEFYGIHTQQGSTKIYYILSEVPGITVCGIFTSSLNFHVN